MDAYLTAIREEDSEALDALLQESPTVVEAAINSG
jgi:hypothetical protein